MTRANSTILVAVLLPLTLAGCRDPLGPERDRLAEARARWEAAAPSSYAYEYRNSCFCPPEHYRVTVRDGVVTEVEWLGQEPPFHHEPTGHTIEELLERIRTALDADPHRADVTYDPTFGYPLQAAFDPQENTVDEEWGFTVESFQPLP